MTCPRACSQFIDRTIISRITGPMMKAPLTKNKHPVTTMRTAFQAESSLQAG
jgi:hypothetical protein